MLQNQTKKTNPSPKARAQINKGNLKHWSHDDSDIKSLQVLLDSTMGC